MADYSKPKPIDPLWYQRGAWVNATCSCGHRASIRVDDLARRHRLPDDLPLHQLIDRLRCSKCRIASLSADVTRHRRWR